MKKQFLLLIVAISICCLLSCCNKDAGEDEEKQIENETAVSQQTPGLEIMERMTEEELKDKKNIYSPDYLIGKGSVEKGEYANLCGWERYYTGDLYRDRQLVGKYGMYGLCKSTFL